jgi:hypothetical protein
MRRAAIAIALAGCYHGARATRDVNAAWRGHARAEIEARWGPPTITPTATGALLAWSYSTTHVELPRGAAHLTVTPTTIDAAAAFEPGAIWKTATTATADVDASGRIIEVRGPSLHWGPPRSTNLHWGAILGGHVGLGRLDTTGTPLPSGGLYIGGMIGPRSALVGTFALVSGTAPAGGALALAWGIATQDWITPRFAVRAGPAMILAFRPGFGASSGLGHALADTFGLSGAASFAAVRTRVFVLDLRAELTIGRSDAFGSLGVGVNLN